MKKLVYLGCFLLLCSAAAYSQLPTRTVKLDEKQQAQLEAIAAKKDAVNARAELLKYQFQTLQTEEEQRHTEICNNHHIELQYCASSKDGLSIIDNTPVVKEKKQK